MVKYPEKTITLSDGFTYGSQLITLHGREDVLTVDMSDRSAKFLSIVASLKHSKEVSGLYHTFMLFRSLQKVMFSGMVIVVYPNFNGEVQSGVLTYNSGSNPNIKLPSIQVWPTSIFISGALDNETKIIVRKDILKSES